MEPPINSWRPIVISCYNQTRFTDGKTEAGRGLVILPGPHTEDRTEMPAARVGLQSPCTSHTPSPSPETGGKARPVCSLRTSHLAAMASQIFRAASPQMEIKAVTRLRTCCRDAGAAGIIV